MPKKSTAEQVEEKVREFLRTRPEGARYSEIIEYLSEQLRDVPKNTLHGSMHRLRSRIRSGEIKDKVFQIGVFTSLQGIR